MVRVNPVLVRVNKTTMDSQSLTTSALVRVVRVVIVKIIGRRFCCSLRFELDDTATILSKKFSCSNFAKKAVTSMTTLTRPRHDWADRGQGKVGGQGITLTR